MFKNINTIKQTLLRFGNSFLYRSRFATFRLRVGGVIYRVTQRDYRIYREREYRKLSSRPLSEVEKECKVE